MGCVCEDLVSPSYELCGMSVTLVCAMGMSVTLVCAMGMSVTLVLVCDYVVS